MPDRLLPLTPAAGSVAAALGLALDRRRANVDDLDVEQLLDRLADLRLVRAVVDAERVLARLGEHERLLGDDWADDHLTRIHQPSPPSSKLEALARATNSSRAA